MSISLAALELLAGLAKVSINTTNSDYIVTITQVGKRIHAEKLHDTTNRKTNLQTTFVQPWLNEYVKSHISLMYIYL